ncbi:MAG TPA: hypothetical protein VIV06_06215 [Candidatus Limnocylindrales bacterium]
MPSASDEKVDALVAALDEGRRSGGASATHIAQQAGLSPPVVAERVACLVQRSGRPALTIVSTAT